jgi:phosphoribosylaminoimidazolecarboxamide formyltransferase / IMP cyclohydrolase
MIKTALISVSNKKGAPEFARELQKLGVKIISTGNTAKILKENGVKSVSVSEVTKIPEMMDGRVKTLHPNIFAGILADRNNEKHMQELKYLNVDLIDLVVVNFYPFEETMKKNADIFKIEENIDIGGPSMVRAAAKNNNHVVVVIDPADYGMVIKKIKNGKMDAKARKNLAAKAFLHTARYEVIISRYFAEHFIEKEFPEFLNFTFSNIQNLRYGENPHQKAAFYRSFWVNETCVSTAKQLQGKELSYNNIVDANDAFELVKEFKVPTAAVIKHTNPCGVASSKTINEAYKRAYEADSKSAFGSVVALNMACNAETAKLMEKLFVEVIICPSFDKGALELLQKKKNLRLLETGQITKDYRALDMKRVVGGLLVQSRQELDIKEDEMKVVTKRAPTKEEIKDLIFAWKVNKHAKSNAIILAKDEATVGVGAGQMARVDSVDLSIMKAGEKSKGSALSSDAFFPFRDGVDDAAKGGITAIIQPGGSIRDKEVIKAADEHNIAMVFTGKRLFRH